MNGSIILATILILFGCSMLLGAIFGVAIPLVRIFIGILIVYWGVSILMGPSWSCRSSHQYSCWSHYKGNEGRHTDVMGSAHIVLDDEQIKANAPRYEYSTVFGGSVIDFTHVSSALWRSFNVPLEVDLSTVFGKMEVRLPKDLPVKITASSAFGKTEFPDESVVTFGSRNYQTDATERPVLIIKASTVFGALEIRRV